MTYEKSSEREATFPEVGAAIAAAMGGGTPMDPGTTWSFTKLHDCSGVLRRQDGLELTLWLDSHGGRIEAKPRPPALTTKGQPIMSLRDYGIIAHNVRPPETTVAFERDPKQAAGQIVRLILAPYEPMYLEVLKRKAEIERKHEDAFILYRDLRDTLRLDPPGEDEGPGQDHHIYLYSARGLSGDITVASYGNVEIKLRSLTARQARFMAESIAFLAAGSTKKKPKA